MSWRDVKWVFILVVGALLISGGVRANVIEIGSNSDPIEFIAVGDDWQFFRGTEPPSNPPEAWWNDPDFVDTGWETGPSGFGYADSDDATILSDMQNNYVTVYIRKEFTASSVPPDAIVQLVIDYDDGFVAYLNGQEPSGVRRNITGTPTYTSTASSHEAGTPETIELDVAGVLLNEGTNILAIEGHNISYGSTDFSLAPALRAMPDSNVTLTEDTTWLGANTYDLKSTVVVPAGVVLTIEPGCVVQMHSGVGINVYGQLLAEGTESQPISFTRNPGGTTWERIMFVDADDSRLVHCIIEYSDCEGDHKDYYDDDCDEQTPLPLRNYFQAVVAIASHVDMEGCVFQNLPGDSGSPEGDAIAIISDDVDHPGDATANIIGCQFLSIGQGVHTRFSYVLIKDCYFTGHHGDNDDIDLYGESTPPPLVLNNILLNPAHDDMINPTRCSAVIIGNIIGGCDDHGVVLRDKCKPIMINNLIYNCSSAGIAVQNQCDALLVNNTIVNCGRGIRFFDHTGRHGPPYCLFPGSGKATIVNCIIWDCPTSLLLTDTSYSEENSQATVRFCNIEGGLGSTSVAAGSTLAWDDESNIDEDPLFADVAGADFHLKSVNGRWNPAVNEWVVDAVNSPCIDTGEPGPANEEYVDWREELWPHGGLVNMGVYGGTPEASMSGDPAGNIADLNHDDSVGEADLLLFTEDWPILQVLLDTDLDRNGTVNLWDFAIILQEWRWRKL